MADDTTTPLQGPQAAAPDVDPLVNVWFSRVKAAEKRWGKLHKRMRHNRKLVRGIDDSAEPTDAGYNKDRANLIQSTIVVVLSKVYAQNPEMSAQPTNKARDLALFSETVSEVTQAMLESAKLKKQAKAVVRAAMTCSYGIAKVLYQRVKAGDQPMMRNRIQDTQEQIQRLHALAATIKDDKARADLEAKKAELQQVMQGLQSQNEVVAAEGLVIDRTPSDRWLIDPAVEDIWEYESARWMAEKIPMPRSTAKGMFPDFDFSTATTYKPDTDGRDPSMKRQAWAAGSAAAAGEDDPVIMLVEVWSKQDNRLFTMVEGCNKQFARPPFTPEGLGERWWPYFLLPFQSVDGEFAAQSLVDVLEKLQVEHNETRDKFAELRRMIVPHYVASADLKDKDIVKKTIVGLGEVITINTDGQPLASVFQEGVQLTVNPEVFDTSTIRNDWEMVSGLQDAARSTVIQPKTATEAAISNQSLSARVAEFRDQVEDWLTEIAQYASEVCLLNMSRQQVEQIMGKPQVDPVEAQEATDAGLQPPQPQPTYEWPEQATPETVFNLVQISIRAGSTAAPNKLQQQQNWTQALGLLGPMIDKIRQLDAQGIDSTPERELMRETASMFDETIDVDRYLPIKPPRPAAPVAALPDPAQLAAVLGGGAPGPMAGVPLPMQVGGRPGVLPAPGGFQVPSVPAAGASPQPAAPAH